jgi:hypothetical protein
MMSSSFVEHLQIDHTTHIVLDLLFLFSYSSFYCSLCCVTTMFLYQSSCLKLLVFWCMPLQCFFNFFLQEFLEFYALYNNYAFLFSFLIFLKFCMFMTTILLQIFLPSFVVLCDFAFERFSYFCLWNVFVFLNHPYIFHFCWCVVVQICVYIRDHYVNS